MCIDLIVDILTYHDIDYLCSLSVLWFALVGDSVNPSCNLVGMSIPKPPYHPSFLYPLSVVHSHLMQSLGLYYLCLNLSLLWCLHNKRVSTVILGASRISQLTDNLAALTQKAKLTDDVLAAVEAVVGNKPAAPQKF